MNKSDKPKQETAFHSLTPDTVITLGPFFGLSQPCPFYRMAHSLASIRAVEDAVGMTVPLNSELIRNIIMGSYNFV